MNGFVAPIFSLWAINVSRSGIMATWRAASVKREKNRDYFLVNWILTWLFGGSEFISNLHDDDYLR